MLQDGMEFPNAGEARAFRASNHCGGFVVVDRETGEAFLFMPTGNRGQRRTPHSLRTHPDLRGRRVAIH